MSPRVGERVVVTNEHVLATNSDGVPVRATVVVPPLNDLLKNAVWVLIDGRKRPIHVWPSELRPLDLVERIGELSE